MKPAWLTMLLIQGVPSPVNAQSSPAAGTPSIEELERQLQV